MHRLKFAWVGSSLSWVGGWIMQDSFVMQLEMNWENLIEFLNYVSFKIWKKS